MDVYMLNLIFQIQKGFRTSSRSPTLQMVVDLSSSEFAEHEYFALVAGWSLLRSALGSINGARLESSSCASHRIQWRGIFNHMLTADGWPCEALRRSISCVVLDRPATVWVEGV